MDISGFIDLENKDSLMIVRTTNSPEILLEVMSSSYSSPEAVSIQVLVIFFVITIAVIGNSLMCYTVYRTPTLRTVTNIYTINLGIADMSIALLSLPAWISALLLGSHSTNDPFPVYWCQTTSFVTVLLLLVSISTIAGISLDRYFSICHPLRYPVEVTPRRVYLTLFLIWLLSFLIATCPLYGWGAYRFRPQTIPICNPAWSASTSFAGFLVSAGIALPLGVMLFSYVRIVQEARRQTKQIDQVQLQTVTPSGCENGNNNEKCDKTEHGETQESKERAGIFQLFQRKRQKPVEYQRSQSLVLMNMKTLKTVFIVIGAFFVCWGPYVILNFWSVNNPTGPVPYLADFITTLLAFGNSAVNPFVFMFLNREFRLALRLVYRRMTLCCHEGGHKPCWCETKKRRASQVSIMGQPTRRPSVDSLQKESPLKSYFSKQTANKPKILVSYDNPNFVLDEEPEIVSPVEMPMSPFPVPGATVAVSSNIGIPGGVVLIPGQMPTDVSNDQKEND